MWFYVIPRLSHTRTPKNTKFTKNLQKDGQNVIFCVFTVYSTIHFLHKNGFLYFCKITRIEAREILTDDLQWGAAEILPYDVPEN